MSYGTYDSSSMDVFGGEPDLYRSTVVSKPSVAPWTRKSFLIASLIMSALTIIVSSFQIATRMNCTHFKNGYVTEADIFEVFAWIVLAASAAYMAFTIYMLAVDSEKVHSVSTASLGSYGSGGMSMDLGGGMGYT